MLSPGNNSGVGYVFRGKAVSSAFLTPPFEVTVQGGVKVPLVDAIAEARKRTPVASPTRELQYSHKEGSENDFREKAVGEVKKCSPRVEPVSSEWLVVSTE